MSEEILDVINEKDEVIGKKSRSEVHRNGDLHRVAHVWVFNSKGQILCQKRSSSKDTHPNSWDTIMGGHVASGSNYEDTAVKELEEEYSLKIAVQQLVPLLYGYGRTGNSTVICKKMLKAFGLKFDGDPEKIQFNKDEVSEIKFFSVEELRKIKEDNSWDFVSFEYFDDAVAKIAKLL